MDVEDIDLVLRTEISKRYYKIKWSIGNADKIPEIIKTPKFPLATGYNTDWHLTGQYIADDSFYVVLHRDSKDEQTVRVECTTCSIDDDGKRISETAEEVYHSKEGHVIYEQPCPINYTLNLEFNFVIYGLEVKTDASYRFDRTDAIAKRFSNKLTKERPLDVRIFVGNEVFLSHRSFLSWRAPMLVSNDLNYEYQACLHDVDPEVFKTVFNYIYTNEIPQRELSRYPKEVYKFACKCGIRGLERICAKKLAVELNHENAVEFFKMAESYREPTLEEAAKLFIRENFGAVHFTEDWKTLAASRPNLKAELKITED